MVAHNKDIYIDQAIRQFWNN